MTAFAAVLAFGLVATSVFGHAWIGGILAACLLLYGAGLHLFVYALRRRRARRAHREVNDRRVVAQWSLAAIAGISAALVCSRVGDIDWHQTEAGGIALGAAIGALGVFASAVFDWYYTHPRVSGLIGPAPCETAGNGSWVGLTNIWYFHRLLATVVVSGALVGVPSTLGALSDSNAARNVWFFATLSMTAVVLFTNKDYASVVRFLKNPRLSVGDIVLLNREEWGAQPQRVYILDVAVEGAKVKLLDADDWPVHVLAVDEETPNLDDAKGVDPGPLRFLQKEDTTMLNDEIARCVHVPKNAPICRNGHCSGVNWYCRANPRNAARAEQYVEHPRG
jgi:hypothetical protein